MYKEKKKELSHQEPLFIWVHKNKEISSIEIHLSQNIVNQYKTSFVRTFQKLLRIDLKSLDMPAKLNIWSVLSDAVWKEMTMI